MNKPKEKDSSRKFINCTLLITTEDLQEFKEDLLLSIKAIIRGNTVQPKKWLKSYQVRKILDISSGTLQTLRNNGTIPFTKIGSIIYYNSEDIDKLLLERQKHYSPGIEPKRNF